MGRPKKVLDARQVVELEKLAAILTMEQIADFFGMANSTLRRKMAEDEGIKSAYKRGKAKAVSGVGQTLLSLAKEGNITAICFYLKTQAGWRETQVVESKNTNETVHRVIFEMPDNQRSVEMPQSFEELKPSTGGNGSKRHEA